MQEVVSYHTDYNSIIKNGGLTGPIVAMVIYCGTQLTATRSPMIGQFVDTMILASTDKERF